MTRTKHATTMTTEERDAMFARRQAQDFDNLLRGTEWTACLPLLQQYTLANLPRCEGLPPHQGFQNDGLGNTSGYLTLRRAEETVTIEWRCHYDFADRLTHPETGDVAMPATLKTSLTWPATGRTLARATVALGLYQDALTLAAELEQVAAAARPYYLLPGHQAE